MTDYGKARVVFITGTKKPPVTPFDQDKKKAQFAAPPAHYRPVVRRGSMDSTTILRTRPVVLTRPHNSYDPRDRRQPYPYPSVRENGLRKYTPAQTAVTPQTELKSILKRTNSEQNLASTNRTAAASSGIGNGFTSGITGHGISTSSSTSNNHNHSHTQNHAHVQHVQHNPPPSAAPILSHSNQGLVESSKCNYRLPDHAGAGSLRKTVSFREDQIYGSRRQHSQRQLHSPRMSIPQFWIKGLEKPQEFFV